AVRPHVLRDGQLESRGQEIRAYNSIDPGQVFSGCLNGVRRNLAWLRTVKDALAKGIFSNFLESVARLDHIRSTIGKTLSVGYFEFAAVRADVTPVHLSASRCLCRSGDRSVELVILPRAVLEFNH